MKCVKVAKKDAERVKETLITQSALSRDFKPVTDEEYIYFPLSKDVEGFETVDYDCPAIEKEEEIETSSFDQVGDIIILSEEASDEDAQKLIKRPHVKVVLKKVGIHKGEFRTQDLEWIAGEKRKETIYKENGVQMELNVETCYFSPRLSTERKRIADLVQDNEKVLVLFSGVAPYPLVIAKHANPDLIVGVEKNPDAHRFALYNCRKIKNIELFNKDAKDFQSDIKFDRILMPLPKSSAEFLPTALKNAKKGTIIHMYDFELEEDIPEKTIEKIKEFVKEFEVISINKVGKYAPGKYRICVDFRVLAW